MSVPTKVLLTGLSGVLPATIDLFVCCASYERRSTCAPLNVPPDRVGISLVCFNDDFEDSVRENRAAIADHFGPKSRMTASISALLSFARSSIRTPKATW